uniref:non-specific serine/threonine protein kinase n=1 Tax=Onchocerca volvulus TaxID=6282 RepID=A0A8R1XYI3_ONCVO
MAQQLVQLNPGDQVDRWHIDKKLGEGGFGAVYLVSDPTGKYALKVEGVNEQIQAFLRNCYCLTTNIKFKMSNLNYVFGQKDIFQVLKMEVYVLTELNKRNNRHFCKIEDKGRFGSFNYVVMTLVGKSLQVDLRKANPAQHFSMGTALGAGIQALEALEDLHSIGYLHRDVKPGNYTIGRPELNELRKVYVLDFGMCRKYTSAQNIIRKPRAAAGFRGTVRYAPISCHLQRELCRKDDVETWIYMQVEITTGNLPWKNIADMNQVGEYKKRCRFEPALSELMGGCAPELRQILQIVDALKYYDQPPYQQIYQLMRQSFQSTGTQEFPYDWEKPGGGVF